MIFFLIITISLSFVYSFNINYDIEKNNNFKECYLYYLKYVQSKQNKDNYIVSFNEYAEYWLIDNESNEIIYEYVCEYIYDNYPKKLLRTNYI